MILGVLLAALPIRARAEDPGARLFVESGCRACHRVGEVGGTSGPDLTFAGLRRSKGWLDLWLADPKAWKHDTLMPRQGLPPAARRAIADYLSSQKGQGFAGAFPWAKPELAGDSVRKGRVIFLRAGCVACHGAKGSGGHPNNNVAGGRIPSLDATAQGYTKAELTDKIRRGVKPQKEDLSGPEPLVSMPAWGQVLTDEELGAVADYLLTLGSGRSKEDF